MTCINDTKYDMHNNKQDIMTHTKKTTTDNKTIWNICTDKNSNR